MANPTEKPVGTTALRVFKTQMEAVMDEKIQEAGIGGSGTEYATADDILEMFGKGGGDPGADPNADPGDPASGES